MPHQYSLDRGDVTNAYGVPTTTVRRTVVDLLGRLPATAQLDLVAWVSSRRLLDDVWLSAWLREHRWHWGNVARAAAATRLAVGSVNPAEDLLHALLRRNHVRGWCGDASLLEHRQNRLVAAGCTVLRYTWEDLVDRPLEVVAQIRATVASLASQLP